jgi:hypothetical protein
MQKAWLRSRGLPLPSGTVMWPGDGSAAHFQPPRSAVAAMASRRETCVKDLFEL